MSPPPTSRALGRGSIGGPPAIADEGPSDPDVRIAVGVAVAHPHDEPAGIAIKRRRHVAKPHPVRIEHHERPAAMAGDLGRDAIGLPALYERAVPTAVHGDVKRVGPRIRYRPARRSRLNDRDQAADTSMTRPETLPPAGARIPAVVDGDIGRAGGDANTSLAPPPVRPV